MRRREGRRGGAGGTQAAKTEGGSTGEERVVREAGGWAGRADPEDLGWGQGDFPLRSQVFTVGILCCGILPKGRSV